MRARVSQIFGRALEGRAWPQGIMAQCKADVESLLQSAESRVHRSVLVALEEPDPDFGEHSRGVLPVAMLCKALDLRQLIDTPGKWARECRRGDGPPANEPPQLATIATDYTRVVPALVFAPPWRLVASHPKFRPHRAGEEQAKLAAAEARDAVGPGLSTEFRVPSDSELGLLPGVAGQCARAIIAVARVHQFVAAARSELGPANPNGANAPGGGVTEIAGLVRAQIR